MPSSYPANIKSPVEYDSSIGYVISTPNSNPTAIIGIIDAPIMKQHAVTSAVDPDKNENAVAVILNADKIDIIITESLYFFFISTHTPNMIDPTKPPTIKTAPKTDAADYRNLKI